MHVFARSLFAALLATFPPSSFCRRSCRRTDSAPPTNPKDAAHRRPDRHARQNPHSIQAAISPDGTTVAWSVRARERIPNPSDRRSQSRSREGKNHHHRDDVPPAAEARSPVWSPNGEWLAFVIQLHGGGEQNSGQDQVFIWSKKTGQSKQLTHSPATSTPSPGHPTAKPSPSSSSRTPPAAPEPSPP